MAKTKEKGAKWGSKLKKFSGGWKSSETRYKEMFGNKDVPKDTYIFQLRDFRLDGDDDNPYILREHVILEGEFKGIPIQERMYFTNDTGAAFLRRYLKMIDVEPPEDIEGLEDTVKEVKELAPVVKGRYTLRDDRYPNIDVVSLITDGEEGEDGEGQEVDLEGMDKSELRAFVKDQDLDIDGYRKMDEDELRAAIAAELGDDDADADADDKGKGKGKGKDDKDDKGDEDEVDFDEMDEEEMREFVDKNDIDPVDDLGFKNKVKYKKADEEALREALTTFAESQSKGDSDKDDDLLDTAKIFCANWDVEIDDDADLDDIKEAIEEHAKESKDGGFPKKELDEEEIATLTGLELEELIIEKKAASKDKAKAKGKGKK